jgi:hypothetical protein
VWLSVVLVRAQGSGLRVAGAKTIYAKGAAKTIYTKGAAKTI